MVDPADDGRRQGASRLVGEGFTRVGDGLLAEGDLLRGSRRHGQGRQHGAVIGCYFPDHRTRRGVREGRWRGMRGVERSERSGQLTVCGVMAAERSRGMNHGHWSRRRYLRMPRGNRRDHTDGTMPRPGAMPGGARRSCSPSGRAGTGTPRTTSSASASPRASGPTFSPSGLCEQSAADETGGQHHSGSLTLPCRVRHLITVHGFASPGCPSDDGETRYGKIMINDNPLQVAAEPGKGGLRHRTK